MSSRSKKRARRNRFTPKDMRQLAETIRREREKYMNVVLFGGPLTPTTEPHK